MAFSRQLGSAVHSVDGDSADIHVPGMVTLGIPSLPRYDKTPTSIYLEPEDCNDKSFAHLPISDEEVGDEKPDMVDGERRTAGPSSGLVRPRVVDQDVGEGHAGDVVDQIDQTKVSEKAADTVVETSKPAAQSGLTVPWGLDLSIGEGNSDDKSQSERSIGAKSADAVSSDVEESCSTETTVDNFSTSTLTGLCSMRLLAPNASRSRIILIGINTSASATHAFQYYVTNLWTSGDLLVLAHIPESPSLSHFTFRSSVSLPADKWSRTIKKEQLKTLRLLEHYETTCEQNKIGHKSVSEPFPNPGEGLCQLAHDEAAQLIVVGARGPSSVLRAVKRAVYGSVSEYIVRNAGLPCLVVPQPM